jgi:hypothetical protein
MDMLVDSGACDTMLPKAFLDFLGVQFSGEEVEVLQGRGRLCAHLIRWQPV